jgi:GDP-L-fucose synthase
MIASVTGYAGEVRFDASQPDGAPRKLLDSSSMAALGWRPGIDLKTGLARTYESYASSHGSLINQGVGTE